MSTTNDTIVAISSAAGEGVRSIVRLSGPRVAELLLTLAPSLAVSHAAVTRTRIAFAALAVPATILTFAAPRSYTTDDVAEIHLPGNDLLARLLIDHLIAHGARQAEPGEFTSRAYLAGRIDLTAAEGVQMAIAAQHAGELKAARQLMFGELARRLQPVIQSIADALALLEAGIDFAEEDISFIQTDELLSRLNAAATRLDEIVRNAPRFEQLSRHPRFVLVGRPNAGKSTLLNALAGAERAVVSPVAGTTRDALSARVVLDRGVVEVVDVAGFEPAADTASAPAEVADQMRARASRAVEEADFVIHVIDATDDGPTMPVSRTPDLRVLNKIDLRPTEPANDTLAISARDGQHLDVLRQAMSQLAFFSETSSGARLALTARHRDALNNATTALAAAREATATARAELIAFDLRHALDSLGDVLGQITPDDVLGRIFAGFCIGK